MNLRSRPYTTLAGNTALGLCTLNIGEAGGIDLAGFTLKGKPIADVRHAIAKIARDGFTFRLHNHSTLHDDPAR